MDEGFRGLELAHKYTQYMDKFLSGIFHSIEKKAKVVLLATGGYGREELAPFQILILCFLPRTGQMPDQPNAFFMPYGTQGWR